MRVTVEIDQQSMDELRSFAVEGSAEEQVTAAIHELLRIKRQREALDRMHGIGWEGDLEEMRNNWS